jgi:Ca2+-binding EF-hand superfamily protein
MISKLIVDYNTIAKEGKISGKSAVMQLAREAHVIDMLIDLSDEKSNSVDPRLKNKVFSDPTLEDLFYGQLLRMFDINNDGEISLQEFVMGLSSLSGGTRAEKAALYFAVNDINGDGELDRDEVYKMQAGVFAAVKAAFAVGLREGSQELVAPRGPLTKTAFEDLMSTLLAIFDLEEIVQFSTSAVFEMQDKDKNGKISKEEFAEWYLDDEQRSKLKQLIESKATPIIQDKAHAVEKKLTSALMKYF